MAAAQPKKMLIMHILEILKKYTDEDHRLSQKEIGEILKNEYDMVVDRKSIKRNLMDLIDLGFEIEYSESVRMVRDKATGKLEESCFLSDFYLVRDFTDSELRLLIDSLLFSKHIPYSQCKELIGKLEGLSNRYFRARVGHIRTMPDLSLHSQQLFYTIEVLDEAIGKGRQVSFTYNSYGTDKKLHPRRDRGVHRQPLPDRRGQRAVLPDLQLRQVRQRGPLPAGPDHKHKIAAHPRQAHGTGERAGAQLRPAPSHGGARLSIRGGKRAGDLPGQKVPAQRHHRLVRGRRHLL